MAKITPKDEAIRQAKLVELERERRRELIFNIVVGSLIFIFSAVFAMLVSGNYFSGILGFFGLESISNEERGVYADCSKPENQKIRYCQQPKDHGQPTLRSLSESKNKGSVFSLTKPGE